MRCFANDGPGIAALLGWLRAQGAELVVANPPADTKDPWCGACLVRGLPGVGSAWCGVWVNVGCRCIWPIPTGRSWPASGKPAKTDRLDAQILSRYGQVFALEGDPQREPEPATLPALLRRRRQLIDQRTQERNRLDRAWNAGARASTQRHIAWLDEEIARLDQEAGPGVPRYPAEQCGFVPAVGAVPQCAGGGRTDRGDAGGGAARVGPGRRQGLVFPGGFGVPWWVWRPGLGTAGNSGGIGPPVADAPWCVASCTWRHWRRSGTRANCSGSTSASVRGARLRKWGWWPSCASCCCDCTPSPAAEHPGRLIPPEPPETNTHQIKTLTSNTDTASAARQSRWRRRHRLVAGMAASLHSMQSQTGCPSVTPPLPYSERMLYNGFTGDKSVPSTRFRAFTANQHQVAAGLCRRLSPTTLIGAVPSATAPATARHASGMENESKNHSAPPPAVGLIPLGTWSNSPNHRLYTLNLRRKSTATPTRTLSGGSGQSPVLCRRQILILGKRSEAPYQPVNAACAECP